jgi:hypothetical protein
MNTKILSPGDIGFVMHNENFISKVFARVMKSKFSHCFVVVGRVGEQAILCETTDFEVVLSTADKYALDKNCSVVVFSNNSLNTSEVSTLIKNASALQGTMYGYLQLVSLLLRRLLLRLKIEIKSFIKKDIVCYQVVVKAFKDTKCHVKNFDIQKGDTEDLYQYCLKYFPVKTTKDVQNG